MQAPVIHVVDDDDQFQIATSRLLKASGYEVRTYSSAGDFLLRRVRDEHGCLLLDVRMPGPSGLDLQEALAKRSDPLPIIFLSGNGDIPSTVTAIKAGAVDFLTKPVTREALLGAISSALTQGEEQRIANEQLKMWRACYRTLNTREIVVFDRVVAGEKNREIANDLGVAERTVKTYRSSLMKKLGATSLAELVHIANQLRAN